jgi:hypothetical protein
MNPTLEVQIIAKIDKLDAGLKMAETKVTQSAQTMGKVGEQGGSMFVDKMVGNMVKGLAMGAITTVLGGGILTALQGVNAGKSGQEIGENLAKGILDGAKGIPIVGSVVAIFDEIVNGAERAAELIAKKVVGAVEKQIDSTKAMMNSLKSFAQGTDQIIAKTAAGKDPMKMLTAQADITGQAEQEQVNAQKELEQQRHVDKIAAINSKYDAIQNSADFEVSRTYSDKKRNDAIEKARAQHRQQLNKIDDESVRRDKARDDEYNAAAKEINEKAAADKKTLEDKVAADAEKASAALVAITKKQKQDEFDVAMQAQQDIIDANKEAQAQIDKIGRVDQMAGQAAQGMISSGQTALGQFNFAQAGAGGTALEMAKKQVMSLEKIEIATAEQVRLTKENKGFQ